MTTTTSRRIAAAAAVALLVIVSLAAPATSTTTTVPKCCVDFHEWGDNNTGCPAEMNDACDTWCQSTCRGGECKQRGNNWHLCHCYC